MILTCILNKLALLMDSEFCVHRFDVILYRVWREKQGLCHFLDIETLIDKTHHVQFLSRESTVELWHTYHTFKRAFSSERALNFLKRERRLRPMVKLRRVQPAEIALTKSLRDEKPVISYVASTPLIILRKGLVRIWITFHHLVQYTCYHICLGLIKALVSSIRGEIPHLAVNRIELVGFHISPPTNFQQGCLSCEQECQCASCSEASSHTLPSSLPLPPKHLLLWQSHSQNQSSGGSHLVSASNSPSGSFFSDFALFLWSLHSFFLYLHYINNKVMQR